MVALIAVALATAHPVAAPASTADPVARWDAFVREAALREGIPEAWIRRVIRAESGGRTMLSGRPITSSAGAVGLMQLMPATWEKMRAPGALGSDPFDPHDNILAGAAFLRLMFDRFGYPGLFGAYNAGPARYAAHLKGAPLPAETVRYLAKVTTGDGRAIAAPNPLRPSLFVSMQVEAPGQPWRSAVRNALFAVRHDARTEGEGGVPSEGRD